jgi:hypothetical protein
MVAGPLTRTRGMDRKIAVGTDKVASVRKRCLPTSTSRQRRFSKEKDTAFCPGVQVKAFSGAGEEPGPRPWPSISFAVAGTYLISTVATPSNFLAMAAASSFEIFSFRGLGAPSTRSLASLRPRLVTSRTALMVEILFAPASLRMTVNSVFSSAGAAAAAPPPAAGAAATAAAAETPRRASSFLTSSDASSRLRDTI